MLPSYLEWDRIMLDQLLEQVDYLSTHSYTMQAGQSDTDLAVVVHRHRGLIDQLFHHSVAADLALHTHIPLLVLQQAKA